MQVYLAVVSYDYEGEPPIGVYSDLEKAQAGIVQWCKKYPETDTVEWSEWIGEPPAIPYMRGYCEGTKFYIYQYTIDQYSY